MRVSIWIRVALFLFGIGFIFSPLAMNRLYHIYLANKQPHEPVICQATSPDGKWTVLLQGSEAGMGIDTMTIYLSKLGSSFEKMETIGGTVRANYVFTWSKDSRYFILQVLRNDSYYVKNYIKCIKALGMLKHHEEYTYEKVFAYDVMERREIDLFANSPVCQATSPDGKWIATLGDLSRFGEEYILAIYLWKPEKFWLAEKKVGTIGGSGWNDYAFTWSNDSRYFILKSFGDSRSHIKVYDKFKPQEVFAYDMKQTEK